MPLRRLKVPLIGAKTDSNPLRPLFTDYFGTFMTIAVDTAGTADIVLEEDSFRDITDATPLHPAIAETPAAMDIVNKLKPIAPADRKAKLLELMAPYTVSLE